MKNFNLAVLGLMLVTFTACGGKKSNSDESSNRVTVGPNTVLTPSANSRAQEKQKIEYGNIITGKTYTKILEFTANKNGHLVLDAEAELSAFCTTTAGGDFYDQLAAEFKVRSKGSNKFESYGFPQSGIFLAEGDELNIYLSFKATKDCGKVDMKISTAFN